MEKINIDLSQENINSRVLKEREEFSKWLSENSASLESIELDIKEKKGNLDELLKGFALMGIEIDTAIEYARKKEIGTSAYLLAQSKRTKDFIYENLMKTYGMIDTKGKILSLELPNRSIGLWRDYIMQKSERGLRQCEFILANY